MSHIDDNDTLLAMVSSLLHQPTNDHAALLDALAQSDGDVQRAATLLNSRAKSSGKGKLQAGSKRKRSTSSGLDGWLKTASPTVPEGSSSSSHSPPKNKKPTIRDSKSASPTRQAPPSAVIPNAGKQLSQAEFRSIFQLPAPSSKKPLSKANNPKPPLTLSNSRMVAENTPCTLHPSILPAELACRLFYTMLNASEDWQRNKWWLFDRVVESPHRTSFYIRKAPAKTAVTDAQEAAQFWYNGRPTAPPDYFPSAMEEACEYIERVVNDELRKRERYPLEWDGDPAAPEDEHDSQKLIWRANVAASNRYEGAAESVGFHSDQLTYLGPYPTIASLSLGTTRVFRLREVIPTDEKDKRAARTYNIPLQHNSLIIMHAGCQESFKHSIPAQTVIDPFHPPFLPPAASSFTGSGDQAAGIDHDQLDTFRDTGPTSNARINITFRFYRPDFQPSSIPRCKCNVPCILRPDMKNRYDLLSESPSSEGQAADPGDCVSAKRDVVSKYWWTCYAGAQNDGKGCNLWKVMDVKAEGRGPFVGGPDVSSVPPVQLSERPSALPHK